MREKNTAKATSPSNTSEEESKATREASSLEVLTAGLIYSIGASVISAGSIEASGDTAGAIINNCLQTSLSLGLVPLFCFWTIRARFPSKSRVLHIKVILLGSMVVYLLSVAMWFHLVAGNGDEMFLTMLMFLVVSPLLFLSWVFSRVIVKKFTACGMHWHFGILCG